MGDIVRVVRRGRFVGWYIRYKDIDGTRRMRASHQPTKELARRLLLEVEGRVVRGRVGMPEPAPPPPTVSELCERFLQEYSRPRIRDLDRYRRHGRTALRRVLPILGSRPADAVQPADIERLRLALARDHAPATARVSLSFLGAVYGWAVKAGIVAENPLRGVERPPVAGEGALGFLDRHEVERLLAVAAERAAAGGLAAQLVHACVHLAVHTGLRKGELLGLRRCDLDLDGRRLAVRRSFGRLPKSGRERHLRLPAGCLPILQAWLAVCPPTPDDLVFPVLRRGQAVAGAEHHGLGLAALLDAAGCRRRPHPWHALRHTFASHFIMSGGNILALQRILGHSDLRVTLQYAHLAPDFLADEMERVKF